MTAKEALKRLKQETAPATYMPDFDKDECIEIINQELDRLKKLEKDNENLLKLNAEAISESIDIHNKNVTLKLKLEQLEKELKQTKLNFKNSQTHSKNCYKKLKEKFERGKEVYHRNYELIQENGKLKQAVKTWNENGGKLIRENTKLKKAIKILKKVVTITKRRNEVNGNYDISCIYSLVSYKDIIEEEYEILKEVLEDE